MMEVFHIAGMVLVEVERLNRSVRYLIPAGPRFLRWREDSPSGPRALDALAFFIASVVWSVVKEVRLVSLSFLSVLVSFLFDLVLLCSLTEENCLLNLSAMFFGAEEYFPLNFIA